MEVAWRFKVTSREVWAPVRRVTVGRCVAVRSLPAGMSFEASSAEGEWLRYTTAGTTGYTVR
jgi:hypothetical protein